MKIKNEELKVIRKQLTEIVFKHFYIMSRWPLIKRIKNNFIKGDFTTLLPFGPQNVTVRNIDYMDISIKIESLDKEDMKKRLISYLKNVTFVIKDKKGDNYFSFSVVLDFEHFNYNLIKVKVKQNKDRSKGSLYFIREGQLHKDWFFEMVKRSES